jgi:hypothetical protein
MKVNTVLIEFLGYLWHYIIQQFLTISSVLMAYLANSAYSSKLDRQRELHQPRTSTATSVCSSLHQKDVWISHFGTAHHRYE